MPNNTPANIVVFFCDQLQRNILRLYGGQMVNTPNLDALAADGTVFDEAYTPTAICSPARASLMTGLYPHRHHMFNNSTPGYSYCHHLRPKVDMVQDFAAANSNYETAYFGKWHIGPADDLFQSKFDHTVATDAAPDVAKLPFETSSHWHSKRGLGDLVQPMCAGQAGLYDGPMATNPDVVAAQYSIDFLEQRDRQRPFMLFCAFPGPHSEWKLPLEWGLRHQPEQIELPANRHDTFANKPIKQRKERLYQTERQRLAPYCNEQYLREAWACMTSYIELIDHELGRVVAKLKAEGVYDNSLIVFTSDHGDMAGAHGMLSKGSYMYDEIYRIALLVKPPADIRAPSRIERAPVNLTDLTATFLHVLAGAEQEKLGEETLHGCSLLPLLSGQRQWERPVHYAEYHGDWYGHYSARMVTDGHWKLVWNLSDLSELYDLDNDPLELTNRFMDPACAAEKQRLFELLLAEGKRLGDGQIRMQSTGSEDLLWDDPARGLELAAT